MKKLWLAILCFALGLVFGKIAFDRIMGDKGQKNLTFIPRCTEKAETMTPETLLSLGRISDPQLSPDGRTILYGVSYTDVAGNRSCRNLRVCNVDGSGDRELTRDGKSISNARWSKDGKYIYFIQDSQVWLAPFRGRRLGGRVKVSNIANGVSEFKISPAENNILLLTTIRNAGLVQPSDTDPSLDKAQAYATEDLMYRHWDHWVTETPRTLVGALNGSVIGDDNSFDILGNEPYELPTEPFGGAEQLDWSPDGRYVAYSCRKLCGKQYAFSTNTDIFIYDVLTGSEIAVTEGGGYDTDPVWSPDGQYLAWISMARDGYEADAQRLMFARIEHPAESGEGQSFGLEVGERFQGAGSLDRDVSGIVWLPGSDGVVFNALVDGVQALYSYDLASESLTRLTSPDWKYDFFSPFAIVGEGAGMKYLTSYYCLNFPTELVAVDSEGFSRITHENDGILPDNAPESESVWIPTVDGKSMQCWVLYPPKFDREKVYPAIEIVLGGPQGTNSQDWSFRWCYRLMAEQGYVVILPNRRGTTAFGQEWKEEISGDYCGLNMQDYLSAGRYLKSKPYIGKLACVGASYGGYSAYMLEGLHDGLYDCFIAHAGIFSERQLWFTTEEMWFANWDNGGLTPYRYEPGKTGPEGDGVTFGGMLQAGAPYSTSPKAVRHYANSPESMIQKWNTPILCIHGMKDYRIPYEQGMAAFNAAQMMGVPSRLLVFPEETHWVLQPQNSLFWHREVYSWLERWLK